MDGNGIRRGFTARQPNVPGTLSGSTLFWSERYSCPDALFSMARRFSS